MKIGEDLYMWIKIARRYKVCFSPAAGKLFEGGLEPFVGHLHARADALLVRGALRPGGGRRIQRVRGPRSPGKSAHHQRKGGTKDAARAIRFFGYTKTYRRTLRKVRILNALPRSWRGPLIGLYNSLAWRIARKGL